MIAASALVVALLTSSSSPVVCGSKKFTEGVILGELACALAVTAGAEARHIRDLGGTRVLFSALEEGEIHVYAEYTGTLLREILAAEAPRSLDDVDRLLAARGLARTGSLGFSNTYALGLTQAKASALGVTRISDLVAQPSLTFGLSNEFIERADGWRGLREAYGLPQIPRGLDHALAYRGLASGTVDVMDLYTTDAEIAQYDLVVLDDDRDFFPRYDAVFLYRQDLAPEVKAALHQLEGKISADAMVTLNAAVQIDRAPEAVVAARLVEEVSGAEARARLEEHVDGVTESRSVRLFRTTREHLALVGISLGFAIVFAVPLGIVAQRRRRIGRVVLGVVAVLQTVPSLAMLVFMIPLLGIGGPPAAVALFLYSLLPIVRNTHQGLSSIPRSLQESAEVLGLPPLARLRLVELPLALPAILAGIKTAAVINVGTATLGALVGAGGYGQPILTGIRLDNVGLILEGAVPAALLALAAQGGFDLLERTVVPRGLRPAKAR